MATNTLRVREVAIHGAGCCVDGHCTPDTCMDLPDGQTCGDCIHVRRCVAMFGHFPTDTSCDWFPRRFKALVTKEKPKSGEPAC